eukprot:3731735-Karenia_brevis.AAC.1
MLIQQAQDAQACVTHVHESPWVPEVPTDGCALWKVSGSLPQLIRCQWLQRLHAVIFYSWLYGYLTPHMSP